MSESKFTKRIVISEREHGLPFSKGLMASSLSVTGLGPGKAYQVANTIEDELLALGRNRVTRSELTRITLDVLKRRAGDAYARAFVKWESVTKLNVPLIVLIGGATGVGKSTIATQLATRLGITRVVSTDAVREVLRSAFTKEMFPTLYTSSFEADHAVRQPIPHSGDRLIIGFREQAAAVAVGAQSLIDRAISEGTDLILEGAHLVPGFLEKVETSENAIVVPVLVVIDDEELHRNHFYQRGLEGGRRPKERYLKGFKKIRRIQRYMLSSAMMRGVPVVTHYDLDATLAQIIDHVFAHATNALERGAAVADDSGLLERAVEVIDQQRTERSDRSEIVP
jgi:2-phosphoglycerate kinase